MSKCIISQRFSLPKATICLLEKNTIENLNNCVIYLYRNYFFTVKRNDDLRLHTWESFVFFFVFVKKNCRLRHKKTSLFLKDFSRTIAALIDKQDELYGPADGKIKALCVKIQIFMPKFKLLKMYVLEK